MSADSSIRRWFSLLTERLAINRAVGYLLLTRIWQCVSYPVTFALLVQHFSKVEQGLYLNINAWLAMQVFAELGLPVILLILASHEWHHLMITSDGTVQGEARALSRLASLEHFGRHWFSVAALLFVTIVGVAGWFWLDTEETGIRWREPWLAAIALNAVSLCYIPRIALLEGCNQVAAINRNRLCAAVTGSFVVWASLAAGLQLWFVAISNLVRVSWELWLVHGEYGRFFRSIHLQRSTERLQFSEELWPLQWRGAVQNVAFFFSNQFLTIVTKVVGGTVASGQLGMTWQVLSMVRDLSFAWVQTRLPQLGAMVAANDRDGLRSLWRRMAWMAVSVFGIGCAGFIAGVLVLDALAPRYAERFLPVPQAVCIMLGLLGLLAANIFQAFVRVHKQDPFVWVNTVGSLAVGWGCLQLGQLYDVWGVAGGYAGIVLGFTLPLSWWLWRRLAMNKNR